MCMLIHLHRNNMIFREDYKTTNIHLLRELYELLEAEKNEKVSHHGGYFSIYKNTKNKYFMLS
jgi:hypothetical protein